MTASGEVEAVPDGVPESVHRVWQAHRARLRIQRETLCAARGTWAMWPSHRTKLKKVNADLAWCKELALDPTNVDAFAVEPSARVLQPNEVQLPLRDYQLHGVQWLTRARQNGISVILGDEMGLGKTLQAIAFLAHLRFHLDLPGPHLIVCPLSVLSHWLSEFELCCPKMRVLKLYGQDEQNIWDSFWRVYPDSFDIAVTTYSTVRSVRLGCLFKLARWNTLILDEGHVIKNEKSGASKAVRMIPCLHTVVLTGTPIQCNLRELWVILNVLNPDLLTNPQIFDDAFRLEKAQCAPSLDSFDQARRAHGAKNVYFAQEHLDVNSVRRIHDLLQLFMLRRLKSAVESSLPPKVEIKIMCPLSGCQIFWYKRFLLKDSMLWQSEDSAAIRYSGTGFAWQHLQNLLMQFRKICNHPYLIPDADASHGVVDDSFIAASGKFQIFDRLMHRLLNSGRRVLVFSQFTTSLDIIERLLNSRGVQHCRLDGRVSHEDRDAAIRAFNAIASRFQVFLLTTRAGGLGLNLQTADTCILFDSDWNPQQDLQAIARVHRIGQRKEVQVYRLISEGTVEERLISRAEKRLVLENLVMCDSSSCQPGTRNSGSSVADWIKDLKFGADAILNSDAGHALGTADLDAIIDSSIQESSSGFKGAELKRSLLHGVSASPKKRRGRPPRTDWSQQFMSDGGRADVVHSSSGRDVDSDTSTEVFVSDVGRGWRTPLATSKKQCGPSSQALSSVGAGGCSQTPKDACLLDVDSDTSTEVVIK